MIEEIGKLLAVRTARLGVLESALTAAIAARSTIDAELTELDAELQRIARQRSAWERGWQQWLCREGVLHQGQEYNLYHLKLAAWEADVSEQRAEVKERWERAEAEAVRVRHLVYEARQRIDLLEKERAAALKVRRTSLATSLESRLNEELAAHRFTVARVEGAM